MSTIFTKIKLDLEEQRFHSWSNASWDLGVSGINESLHVPSIPINIISICGNSIKNMRSKPCHSPTTSFDFEDSMEDSHKEWVEKENSKIAYAKAEMFHCSLSIFLLCSQAKKSADMIRNRPLNKSRSESDEYPKI